VVALGLATEAAVEPGAFTADCPFGNPGVSDGAGRIVSYTGPEFWRMNAHSTLNMHSEPSASSPVFAHLQRGMVVRNLGCQKAEGRTWCMVPMVPNDGFSIGWVAAEHLVAASVPAAAVDRAATSAPHTKTVRVRFASGTTDTKEPGTLWAGSTVRFLLGAQKGEML